MFYMCYQLAELDVSGFNTANVTDMSYMFACYNVSPVSYPGSLTSLDLHGWNFANVTSVAHLFDRQENLASFSFPDTTDFASLTTMDHLFSQCLALTPATFKRIVATWTFENHADYETTIYGNSNTSLFGSYENQLPGSNNSANYIFREKTMTANGKPFGNRHAEEYWTKDVVRLYIGGGNNIKSCRLTIQP